MIEALKKDTPQTFCVMAVALLAITWGLSICCAVRTDNWDIFFGNIIGICSWGIIRERLIKKGVDVKNAPIAAVTLLVSMNVFSMYIVALARNLFF